MNGLVEALGEPEGGLEGSVQKSGREMPGDAVVALWGEGRMWWEGRAGKPAKELSVVFLVDVWGSAGEDLDRRRDSALL